MQQDGYHVTIACNKMDIQTQPKEDTMRSNIKNPSVKGTPKAWYSTISHKKH